MFTFYRSMCLSLYLTLVAFSLSFSLHFLCGGDEQSESESFEFQEKEKRFVKGRFVMPGETDVIHEIIVKRDM